MMKKLDELKDMIDMMILDTSRRKWVQIFGTGSGHGVVNDFSGSGQRN